MPLIYGFYNRISGFPQIEIRLDSGWNIPNQTTEIYYLVLQKLIDVALRRGSNSIDTRTMSDNLSIFAHILGLSLDVGLNGFKVAGLQLMCLKE